MGGEEGRRGHWEERVEKRARVLAATQRGPEESRCDSGGVGGEGGDARCEPCRRVACGTLHKDAPVRAISNSCARAAARPSRRRTGGIASRG